MADVEQQQENEALVINTEQLSLSNVDSNQPRSAEPSATTLNTNAATVSTGASLYTTRRHELKNTAVRGLNVTTETLTPAVAPAIVNQNDATTTYATTLRNLEEAPSNENAQLAECAAYAEHINNTLSQRQKLWSSGQYCPVTADNLIQRMRDGVLLGHLLDSLKPGSVPVDLLTHDRDLSTLTQGNDVAAQSTAERNLRFTLAANHQLVLNGAKQAGVVVVNIGSEDLLAGSRHLVLGLVWQLVRAHLMRGVSLAARPELIRLLQPNESLSTLFSLSSDQILLRWLNYHLVRAQSTRRVQSLSVDLQDCEVYATLLEQIAPNKMLRQIQPVLQALREVPADTLEGRLTRAELLLQQAAILGARRFVTAQDIAVGHGRLNLAFVATLFNAHVGIRLPSEEESRALLNENDLLHDRVQQLEAFVVEKDRQLAVQADAHALAESQQRDSARAHAQNLLSFRQRLSEQILSLVSSVPVTALQEWVAAPASAALQAVTSSNDALTSDSNNNNASSSTAAVGSEEQVLAAMAQLQSAVERLVTHNKLLREKLFIVESTMAQQEKLNDLIATKVYEHAESLVQAKKREQKKK